MNITNAGLVANEGAENAAASVTLSVEKIHVRLNEITASARVDAELVVGSDEAKAGTLNEFQRLAEYIPSFSDDFDISDLPPISSVIAHTTGINENRKGETLNLASLKMTDVHIELDSGEYLSAERILLEDADAGGYIGENSRNANNVVASYAFNEEGNTLTLNNAFGSTTYSYTPSVGTPEPRKAAEVSAFDEPLDYVAAKINCVSSIINFAVGAPYVNISNAYRNSPNGCNNESVSTDADSLIDAVSGATVIVSEIGRMQSLVFPESDAQSGDILGRAYAGIDSTLEPITFSIAAEGELGLTGGMTVPYQMNFNHLGAFDYDASATVGIAPTALTANYSTLEKDITVSMNVPFTPADAAYAPVDVNVKFSYDWTKMRARDGEEAETLGTLTVNGITVATLASPSCDQIDEDASYTRYYPGPPLVLTFSDGTHPADGNLFITVEKLIIAECAEEIETPQKGGGVMLALDEPANCREDQPGIINLDKIYGLFFEGLPSNDLD